MRRSPSVAPSSRAPWFAAAHRVARAVALAAVLAIALAAPGFAAPEYVPGEVLVRWKPDASAARRAAVREAAGAQVLARFEPLGIERLQVTGDPQAAAASLAARADVAYAEPNYLWYASLRPNDPGYPLLYGLHNAGQTGGTPGADVRAEAAWDLTTGNPELLVGVVDTGFDWTHPDLAANVWTNPGEIPGNGVDDDGNGYVDDVHGWDFVNHDANPMDDNGHGTHVSGTIAAVGNNGIGVTGVAWHARLVGLKFLNSSGGGSTADAITAILYATRIGVRVLNNSWGGSQYSQALRDAIVLANDAGIVFVAAAGNAGSDNDVRPTYPASYELPNIITVAATDRDDQLAPFSNWGAISVDLAAPGVDIYSTWPLRAYQRLSGTSMATPFVTGACALLLGRHPDMPPDQVRQRVLATADRLPGLAGRCVSGGRLDLWLAVSEPDTIPPGAVGDLAVESVGSTSLDLTWTATGDDGSDGRATRMELRWSTAPLTDENYLGGVPAALTPPLDPGSTEHARLYGLPIATTVYVAVRALDEFGNPGPISNVASATTLAAPVAAVAPASLAADLRTGELLDQEFEIANDSPGTLEWRIPTPTIEVGGTFALAWPAEVAAKGQDGATRGVQPFAAGGPDAFGYRWLDSFAPGGPAYAWVDIERPEYQLDLTGDDVLSDLRPMGLSFPFYGRRYTSVRVCTNGYLTFADDAVPYVNSGLPSVQGAHTMIAPCWDDLNFGATTRRAFAHSDGSRFVVTWLDVPRYSDPASTQTFQAILWPSGEIRFQYRSGTGVRNNCTVGMQDTTRTQGLTVSFNQDYVRDSLAVRIVPLRQWLTAQPDSGFLAPGARASVRVRMDASGLPTGDYAGAVHVRTNDPVRPDLAVAAAMHVTGAPDAVFGPAALDFGDVYVGVAETLLVRIENSGVDVLHLLWKSDDAPFTLGFAPVTLLPGEVVTLPVEFRPTVAATYERTLQVACDDPDQGLLRVHVTARSLPPPVAWLEADSLAGVAANGMDAARRVRTRPLRLRNDGDSPLHWRARPATGLAPGEGGAVGITRTGGPDAGGYRWTDSDEPGGPEYQWREIAGVGTRLFGSADDSTRTDVPLPFDFRFYGVTYRSVNVCTNGWLSFTSRAKSFRDVALPDTSAPRALIAPWWDDLDLRTTTGGGRAYAWYDGTRFVIEWRDAVHYAVGGPYTFQVLLSPDGTVDLQYESVGSPSDRATIGLQDESGTRGFTIAHDASWAHAALRVRIQHVPDWLAVEPDSGVLAPGAEDTLQVRMDADGLGDGVHTAALEMRSDDVRRPQRLVPVRLVVSRTPVTLVAAGPIGALAHQPLLLLGGQEGAALEALDPAETWLGGLAADGPPIASPQGLAVPFRAVDVVRAGLGDCTHRLEFAGLAGARTWLSDSVLLSVSRPPLEVAGLPRWDAGEPQVQARSGSSIGLSFAPPALVDRYEIALSPDDGRHWSTLAATPGPGWTFVPLVVSDRSLLEVTSWRGDSLTGAWLSAPFTVAGPIGTGVGGTPPRAFALRLARARPDQVPMRLELDLPQAVADLRVDLFDLRGARVRTLARGARPAGTHALEWDGRGAAGEPAASGVYFARASAAGASVVRRIVLAR
ncbi:MAG: S8 family serine peptidase [Candidatus Eisenbacteria bacterium]